MTETYRKLPRVSYIPSVVEFNNVLGSIKTEDGFATPLSVSVFVICGSLNSHINLEKLLELYEKDEDKDGSMIVSWNPKSKKSSKIPKVILENNKIRRRSFGTDEKWVACKNFDEDEDEDYQYQYLDDSGEWVDYDPHEFKSFYNSLKIETKIGDNNISAKIFKNGKIHITGCRTIEIVHRVPYIFKNYLEEYYPGCINDLESYTLYDQTICMINTLTNLNREIDRDGLKDVINSNTIFDGGNWRSATRPKRHQGVIARYLTDKAKEKYKNKDNLPCKVEGQVTVIVFRSGKVIITGAKSLEDIKEAYNGIVSIVRDNIDNTIMYYSDSDDSDSD